jgi:hypothetical protein
MKPCWGRSGQAQNQSSFPPKGNGRLRHFQDSTTASEYGSMNWLRQTSIPLIGMGLVAVALVASVFVSQSCVEHDAQMRQDRGEEGRRQVEKNIIEWQKIKDREASAKLAGH